MKEWTLGVGCDVTGQTINIQKYVDENIQKQFQFVLSGQFGSVNQQNKRFEAVLNSLVDEKFLDQIQQSQAYPLQKFVKEKIKQEQEVVIWNY